MPDSLKIPSEVPRNWYAIPNFNTSNYQTNRIRIYMTYSGQMHMPMLNRPDPKVQVDPYASGEGQTDQLEGSFVNGCIDSQLKFTMERMSRVFVILRGFFIRVSGYAP